MTHRTKYSYVSNTPTSFTDPSGFEQDEPIDEVTVFGQRFRRMTNALRLALSLGGRSPLGTTLEYRQLDGLGRLPDPSDFNPATEDVNGCTYSNVSCFATDTGVLAIVGDAGGDDTGFRSIIGRAIGVVGHIIDAGGLYTGSMLLNTISADGTRWKGKNGKWNRIGWPGNQHTAGRSKALRRAKNFKLGGQVLFLASAGFSVHKGIVAYNNRDAGGMVEAAGDLTFGAVGTFGGRRGQAAAYGYFVTGWLVEIPSVRAATVTPIVDGLCSVLDSC